MGQHKCKGTYKEHVTAPVADYNVTGTLTPDATCNYFLAGTHNGQPYCRRADGAYFIFSNFAYWLIATELNDDISPEWHRDFEDGIAGEYLPTLPNTGSAFVSTGPH